MIRRFAPLLLLVVPILAAVAAYLVAGPELWHPDALLARRDTLKAAVELRPVLSLVLFTAVYFAIISSALPVGPPMSLTAGFLFGRWIGTPAILLAATGGALVVFWLARLAAGTGFGRRLGSRAGPVLATVTEDIRRNAFGYVVAMRLIPIFPFFAVNAAAGLVRLPVRPFALGTLVGRLPGTFAYVSLGEEVGRVDSVADLASPRIYLTLTAIGLLALLPLAAAGWRRHRAGQARRIGEPPAEGRT
ncbi:TVP38/TMEM64 family protein [Enterovirga sp.]|uniref:TVP38/TMEM64 family protein n=1 Tax=Enterovirga sp. TaxID=2026350 RepID=UPI00263013C4|nr:TVP38/TMEM64 family protein [Enterovirga sp.]